MFRNMRRDDRAISLQEAVDILRSGEYGVLSMMGVEGYPYGLPVNYVYENDVLYIHSAPEGHKLDAIRRDPKVSFVVVGKTTVQPDKFTVLYSSTIVFGRASEVEAAERREALMAFIRRYSSDFLEKGTDYVERSADEAAIIRIDIDHISGKARKII
jgi:hypothetical protein